MASLTDALAHMRGLLEGTVVAVEYPVAAGYLRPLDDTLPLEDQPSSIFAERPVDVAWVSHEQPPDGPDYVSGNLIDHIAAVSVKVGYLQSIGGDDAIQAREYDDSQAIRRCLESPKNYDEQNTGIVEVRYLRAKRRTLKGGREMVEMDYRVRVRETQP